MSRTPNTVGHSFGLCRRPPVLPAPQTDFGFPSGPVREGQAAGGGGGLETVHKGIDAALFGMRTLYRNRQLLWFTIFAGLVLVGNSIGHATFRYINRTLQPDTLVVYTQDFVLSFATLFCLVFLLAALVLSISSKKEGPASCLEGLCEAKKYLKTIFIWTLVLTLAALLLDRIYIYISLIGFPHEFGFIYTFIDGSFVRTIAQFPFNWTLDWDMLTGVPGYGGRSLLLLIYPFGVLETLHFSLIILVLFILTPFVVPFIVLEHKTLKEAVAGSFALLKKTWDGAAVCALFLGAIVTGIFLMHLLLQAASGIVDPYNTVIFHPTVTWIALALLYNIALLIMAFIIATVGGIAVLDLYRTTKNKDT